MILSLFFSYLPDIVQASDDFDPDYLISDEEMQEYSSLSRADIQAFLSEYNSGLAHLKTADKDGKTRTASDIIYRASLDHSINPKYLLVKLQKEQSLITDTSPTQKKLDGATGYGIADSCGWSCATYLNNKGFGKQVDSAAGIIRWYYEHYNQEPWIKKKNTNYNIDGNIVSPLNLATAFLYTYTPHIEGNKNFWNLWNKWFSQNYPDGTLVREMGGSNIYLLQDGKKRKIKNMSVLVSRFDPKMIVEINKAELNNYLIGPEISFPNYSILKNANKYYLLDNDELRPFASYSVVQNLGYNPAEFIEVTNSDIQNYKTGTTIKSENLDSAVGKILQISDNKFYYLKDNTIRPIIDSQIIKINFPNLEIEQVPIADLAKYELGNIVKFKDGTLLGIGGSNKIYVIENGKKRHIASEEVFEGYGFSWKNIVWTNQTNGTSHPTGQAIYLPTSLTIASARDNSSTTDNESSNTPDNLSPSLDNSGFLDTQYGDEIIENGKMFAVPENKTIYTKDKFDTYVNTYLVADYNTGEILAGKNIDTVRPMASLTKVATAYELMREGLNLNLYSTYNSTKHKAIYHSYRISDGEKVINSDLLKAMLVSSLNTPAKMLVNEVNNSEEKFLQNLNNLSQELKLKNTAFFDVYGYSLKNLTTAREYLTLYQRAEKNKTVRDYLGIKNYSYTEKQDLDGNPNHFDNHSNDLMNQEHNNFEIISSKTGYLYESGSNLIMHIKRKSDNKEFIIITLGNPNINNRFSEPKNLTNWAINNF